MSILSVYFGISLHALVLSNELSGVYSGHRDHVPGFTLTLPWVIPMYITISCNMEEIKDDKIMDPKLCEAVTAGHNKLKIYYSYALSSQYTRLATRLFLF